MLVVADTAPLNYPIQIDCDGLLPKPDGRIVMQELSHAAAPTLVRRWLAHIHVWIDVHLAAAAPEAFCSRCGAEIGLMQSWWTLTLGAVAAIQLAEEQHAYLLLID